MGKSGKRSNREKLLSIFSAGQLHAPHSPVVFVRPGNKLNEDHRSKDEQGGLKRGFYGLLDDKNASIDVDVDMDIDNEQHEHINKRQKICSEPNGLQIHQEFCTMKLENLAQEWKNHYQLERNNIQQYEQQLAYQFQMDMLQQQQRMLAIPSNDEDVARGQMLLQEKLKERQRRDEERRLNMIKALEEQKQREIAEQQRLVEEQLRKQEQEKQKKIEQERQQKLIKEQQEREEVERKKKDQELLQQQIELRKKNEELKKVQQPSNNQVVRPKHVSETVQLRVTESIVLIAQKSALDEEKIGSQLLSKVREQIKQWSSSGTQFSREKTNISKKMTSEVSQISATTQQVRRKIVDLLRVIDAYSGTAKICAQYQIAAKIILQCESQVARLPTFVFPLAEVATTVGVSHPDILKILLALLREKCMLVVPKQIVLINQEADSNLKKDYLLRLGYTTKKIGLEEQMESSDDYIDRLKGYMRLYGALMQASNKDNHYGIDNAWRWLARALNSIPPSRALAVSVLSILQVTGYSLNQKYRSQFQKLLLVVQEQLVPKLQAKHDSDLSAVIVNIKTFCSTREYQRPPEGKNMPFRDESQVLKA